MKKIFLISGILVLSFIFWGCSKDDAVCADCDGMFSDEVTVWINNRYFDCGNGQNNCIQAQISDTINENNWQVWTDTICGFDFEPQYRYQLSVRRKKTGKNEQNEIIYKYCLIKISNKVLMYL